jgi:putative membrane protein insertion efficiency factor
MRLFPAGFLAIGILTFYKKAISPWLPPSCRFSPTCSEFASAAIERYGLWRGLPKAVARILRCQPFGSGGFDPLR